MTSREIVRGTEESCRDKALTHIKAVVEDKFTETTTDAEKFWAYVTLHKTTEVAIKRCRENFQGDHYLRFQFDPALATALETANRIGVLALEELEIRMATLREEGGESLGYYQWHIRRVCKMLKHSS